MIWTKVQSIFKNETLRNGVFFTLFSFANKGINFVLLIILARYITPTEYGYWSLFGTIVMFVGYFIAMTTEGYITIAYFKDGMSGVKKSFSCILLTTLIVSCFLISVTSILRDSLQQILDLPWQYLYLAIGIAFFTIYSNICLDYLRIKKKIALYGIFSCSSAILVFGLSIVFVKYCLIGWRGCALAQFIGFLLFGMIGLCYFLFSKKFEPPNIKHWAKMLAWGIPLIPHLATAFIRFGCDRYIINHYYSITDVGIFSFAYTLAMAISTIGMGFNQANSINIFEVLGNKEIDVHKKNILLKKQKQNIFLVYIGGTLITILLGTTFIPTLFPQYSSASPLFLILAFYAFFQCLYFLYANFFYFYNQTKILMYITFSFSILHLVLSLLFTKYSLYYTCLIYCITQLGVSLLIRRNAIKLLNKQLNHDINRS